MGKASSQAGEKLASNVVEGPGRALKTKEKVGSAAATKNPQKVFSPMPDLKSIYLVEGFVSWNNCICTKMNSTFIDISMYATMLYRSSICSIEVNFKCCRSCEKN